MFFHSFWYFEFWSASKSLVLYFLPLFFKFSRFFSFFPKIKIFFALSKWPHFHRAYLVTICNRMSIAVDLIFFLFCRWYSGWKLCCRIWCLLYLHVCWNFNTFQRTSKIWTECFTMIKINPKPFVISWLKKWACHINLKL